MCAQFFQAAQVVYQGYNQAQQILQNARDFRDVVVSTKDYVQEKAQQASDWYYRPSYQRPTEEQHFRNTNKWYLPDAPIHDGQAQLRREQARRHSKKDLSHWFSGNKLISSQVFKREYGGKSPIPSPYTYPLSTYPTRPSNEYVFHYAHYRPIETHDLFAYYDLYPKKNLL